MFYLNISRVVLLRKYSTYIHIFELSEVDILRMRAVNTIILFFARAKTCRDIVSRRNILNAIKTYSDVFDRSFTIEVSVYYITALNADMCAQPRSDLL